MIVTLCRPVAMIPATGAKEDCKVSEGRTLLADPVVKLAGACVTLAPLHNKTRPMQAITRKGGDYLVGAKHNTSKRLDAAKQALGGTPFLKKKTKPDTAG